jgi:diguanylate cyclase (GGDEF)-like protein/PAS domain S-box-containing protein
LPELIERGVNILILKWLKIALLLLAILSAGLASAKALPLQTIDFQLRWHHQFQFAGYYAAIERGYYREEGLDVRLHEGEPGRTPVEEVLAGRAHYAESNSELLIARMQGKPVVALAAIFQHSPSVLLVRKDTGIHSPHDLIGKTIMLMNAGTDADFLAMFRHEGIQHVDIEAAELNQDHADSIRVIPSSYDFEDLISGKVSAFNSYLTNEPFVLQQKGIEYTVINPSTYGIDFYSDILFTTEHEIKENPERVEAFRRATLKGWRYAMDQPDKIIDLLLTKYQVPKSKAHLKFEADAMRSLVLHDLIEIGHMNPGRWQRIMDAFVDVGMGTKDFSLAGFIYDPTPKQLPGWVTPTLVTTILSLILISSSVLYLFRLNRRVVQSESVLRLTNVRLTAEIDAHKLTEDSLRESDDRFRTLFDCSPEPVWIIDGNCFVECNQSAVNMLGYLNKTSLINTHPSELSPEFQPDGEDSFAKAERMMNIAQTNGFHRFEWIHKRADGSTFTAEVTLSAITLQGRAVIYCVWRDITERKAAADEINNLAFYDPLTGLANRRLLMDRLKQALASSARTGKKGALLYLDFDHFKTLNDTQGHHMGDLLLKQVGGRLISCVREEDTVARFGGDEFVVMLENLSEQSFDAENMAEAIGIKILKALAQSYQLGTLEYSKTVSMGVTLFNGHDQKAEELLKQADIAMYQSKKAGRNTLHFFDPSMQANIDAHALLEANLRYALDKNQFQLYYQPQVREDGQIIGAETLIRWIHPDFGLVLTDSFISLAEEIGIIVPIGQWVLETACAQLKAWQQRAERQHLFLAVNVSAIQFHRLDFVEQVKKVIQQYAIDPRRLKLELTESVLLNDIDRIIVTMNALNEIGIQFSLDDFGTGYSSLQYLKRLPLAQLKIERSFTRDISTDSDDEAIINAIIAVAHSLGLNVIAEGVETEQQRQLLLKKGCKNYQGYLFGKPVPIEQFEALLPVNENLPFS